MRELTPRPHRRDGCRLVLPRRDPMLIEALVYCSDRIAVDEKALVQLADAAALPGVRRALATPDIHTGYGVPIGAVVALHDSVVPAAVGYDINCGMRLLTTPLTAAAVDVAALADATARLIPLGEGKSNVSLTTGELARLLEGGMDAYLDTVIRDERLLRARNPEEEADDRRRMEDGGALPASAAALPPRALERGAGQLGTLGGGNHFIEFQVVDRIYDEPAARAFGLHPGLLTVMIHSGSRGLGHEVGGTFMRRAQDATRDSSPSAELCWLPSSSRNGRDFVAAMGAAANFAYLNRQIMTALVRLAVRDRLGDLAMPLVYDVTHNMAKRERHGGEDLWVHRKGATRAFPASRMADSPYADVGQPVIIPGSMGTASYVLVGTESSAESLNSVNHGAGRVMSRTAAAGGRHGRRRKGAPAAAITDDEFRRAMRGVHIVCAHRGAVKEEAPQAYKDIDEVVQVVAEAGLARVVARLRPLAVLKG